MLYRIKQKKFGQSFLAIFAFVFCALSFLLAPINLTSAQSDDDNYENFSSSILQMMDEFDDWGNDETITLQSEDYILEDEDLYVKSDVAKSYALTDETESAQNSYLKISSRNVMYKAQDENLIFEKTPEINRLIVESPSKIDSCGAALKAEYNDYHIFQYRSAEEAEKAYDYYSNLNTVYNVGYDYVVTADSDVIQANTSSKYMSWGAEYVGYEAYTKSMLEVATESELPEVVVAVIDSGLNTSHVLFKNRILYEYGKNFTAEKSNTQYEFEDYNGHGTHVSGTIVESTLSNVKILPLKVLKSDGKGVVASIINAVIHAQELKASKVPNLKMMNMSVGVDTSSSATSISLRSSSLSGEVKNAYAKGIISIVAAGNESQNTSYAIPANVDCAITVSAVFEDFQVLNYKLTFCDFSNYGKHVDFCAPGYDIESAYIGSTTAKKKLPGTSMAAPHVTAAVALVYSNPYYKDYDFDQLMTLLKQNADRSVLNKSRFYGPVASNDERDDYYGYGLINIASIGLINIGEVTFSNLEENHTTSFNLSLSYSHSADEICKIYYSTDESLSAIDIYSVQNGSDKINLFTTPLTISETTKVTAGAFIYDSKGNLIKKSYSKSIVYYFNNFDLNSNFEYSEDVDGLTITKYNGKLTTLNLPEKINGLKVVGIGATAFNNSSVENLVISENTTTFDIGESAFANNKTLLTIKAKNAVVQIGLNAFRSCSNFETLDMENVETIGDYAFAYCTSLKSLNLPKITSIGLHSLSYSGVEGLLLGKDIATIKNQTSLNLKNVYGYAETEAENFAIKYNSNFQGLDLKFISDIAAKKILKANQECSLSFKFQGYEISYDIVFTDENENKQSFSASILNVDDYNKSLTITANGLPVGKHYLSILLTDGYGTTLSSKRVEIIVLENSTPEYNLSFNSGNYKIYLNEEELSSSTKIYGNTQGLYSLRIEPVDGYQITYLTVNGKSTPVDAIDLSTINQDVSIVVSSSTRESLNVKFNYDQTQGKVKINNTSMTGLTVSRNENLSFEIETEAGYSVKRVTSNGVLLKANDNGVYTLSDITVDYEINIVFSQKSFKINVILGGGGNYTTQGGSMEAVGFGGSRKFVISCNEGYVVDAVTVNGKLVDVENNILTVENIDEDCDIVISFKPTKKAMFNDENSYIIKYFIVLLGLFIVFIIARLSLAIVRRRKALKRSSK